MRLVVRAQHAEHTSEATWDQATLHAAALRARIELLRSGSLSDAHAKQVLARAKELTLLLVDYEAQHELGRGFCGAACGSHARGWGTSRGIAIAEAHAEVALDAYSTGVVLGAVLDAALYAARNREPDWATQLYRAVLPVIDYWTTVPMFTAPDGYYAWEKFQNVPALMRSFIVFNTDAMLARDLAQLALLADHFADHARSERAIQIVASVGSRLREKLVLPVLAGGDVHPEAWLYGLRVKADGSLVPQRVEDTNHASFTLDFLALAATRGLRTTSGELIASNAEVGRLSTAVRQAAFPTNDAGAAVYALFIDARTVELTGVRAKRRAFEFSTVPTAERKTRVVSWWKELAGPRRSLDLGLSIRTCWGWLRAARRDPRLVHELGLYLVFASGCQFTADAGHGSPSTMAAPKDNASSSCRPASAQAAPWSTLTITAARSES
jgi:hypothetical protein